MKQVLITGANGFVGQRACRTFAQRGTRVLAAWRGGGSFPVQHELVEPVEVGNLETFDGWLPLLENVDAVVHLAARVHVMEEEGSDVLQQYRDVNVTGTLRLARAAVDAGVGRFVFVSSVKAMGEESEAAYSETSTCDPTDPYGVSKLEAEQALFGTADSTCDLDVVVVRPPLVYGPGVKANFQKLLAYVERGLPWPFGSMSNRRSFVFVGNLADAIAVCSEHPKAPGEIFLVSDGTDLSVSSLLQRIARVQGKKLAVLPFSGRLAASLGKAVGKGEIVRRLFGSLTIDSSKIRRTLDWEPPYSLERGLTETVEWYSRSRQ